MGKNILTENIIKQLFAKKRKENIIDELYDNVQEDLIEDVSIYLYKNAHYKLKNEKSSYEYNYSEGIIKNILINYKKNTGNDYEVLFDMYLALWELQYKYRDGIDMRIGEYFLNIICKDYAYKVVANLFKIEDTKQIKSKIEKYLK